MVVKCLKCGSSEVVLMTKIDVDFQFDKKGDIVLNNDFKDEIYLDVEYGSTSVVCECTICGKHFSYDQWRESLQQKEGNDEIFELNKDVTKRDEIIFGNYDRKSYVGGVRRFEDLSLEKLRQLVDLKFIDLEEYHNSSPTVREFIEFMEKYEEYNAIGYTVSIDREDYCILTVGDLPSGSKKLFHALFESYTDHGKKMRETKSRVNGFERDFIAVKSAMFVAGIEFNPIAPCHFSELLKGLGAYYQAVNPEIQDYTVVSQKC